MSSGTETTDLIFEVDQVDFVVNLPDGSTESTSLGAEEARDLIGTESEFSMHWWMHAAKRKLAVHEFLASLVSSSAYQVGASCIMRQEENAVPRFEITYGYPKATHIAAV